MVHLQGLAYLIAAFIVIKKYKTLLLENYSNASTFHYSWLFQFTTLMALNYFIASIKNVFMFMKIEEAHFYALLITSLITLGLICWVVWRALQSPELFSGIDSKLQLVRNLVPDAKPTEPNIAPPSASVNLEVQQKIDKLKNFMTSREPFLDASLSTYKLASQLKIPTRELSLLINRDLNQHFFDFVNGYRIKKAMEILQNSDKKDFTVLEILYKVGFNSKSSFNTAFKKHTQMTPTQFRKNHSLPAS